MPSLAVHVSVHSQPGCLANGAATRRSSATPSRRALQGHRLAEWAMTEDPLAVVVAAQVVQEAGCRLDDVTVALPAPGERRVDMLVADPFEVGDGATVEGAVVALAQPGVDAQRHVGAPVGQLGGLDGASEV